MKIRSLLLASGAALALAGAASAQETIDFVALNGGSVNSGGNVGTSSASTRTTSTTVFNYTFANSFLWSGTVTVSGALRNGGVGTFANEARIVATSPSNGASASPDIQLFTSNGFSGTLTGTRTLGLAGFTGVPFNPAGQTWSFRFYESFNDSGSTSDAFWDNITVTFNAFVPPTPPACINLGNVSNASYPATQAGSLAVANQVDWYCFNVAANTVLDMHTFYSGVLGDQTDTEIGLYDSNGFLVATNDDLGGGIPTGTGNFNSGITTGGGSGIDLNGEAPGGVLAAGTGTNIAGFLAAGTYYLAVGGFNSNFASNGFGATGGAELGSYSLTLIPTPSAAAMLGLGALAMGRRRRA